MTALDPPLIRAVRWLRTDALAADKATQAAAFERLAKLIEAEVAAHAELRAKVNGTAKLAELWQRKHGCLPKSPSAYFAEFWAAWPSHERKRNKSDTERAWDQMGCDKFPTTVLDALERAKASTQWASGEFVPMPASWLRAQGWADEYFPAQAKNGDPAGWAEFLEAQGLAYTQHKYAPEHVRSAFATK